MAVYKDLGGIVIVKFKTMTPKAKRLFNQLAYPEYHTLTEHVTTNTVCMHDPMLC